MRGEFIHQIYIADGFDDDCDALIQRCIQSDRLNFQIFCEIWKDMKFDSLFIGRTSAVEIAELSEELIHTAKQYMMLNTSNFEETVAGLFLVYGLLSLQPYFRFAVLRLIPSDVPAIKRIEMIARKEKRHDVLYILGAVLIKHTQYHAEQRERGMEQVYRKYLNGYTGIGIDPSGFRPRGTFYRQTEELDVLRELASLTDRYDSTKKAVTGGKVDPSLSFINKKLPGELDASLKRLISGIPGADDDEDDIDEADVHYSKVQQIKEKAMKNAVGGMKHLTSASERTPESKIVSEIKSKPGKLKTSSPKKASSPKKSAKLQTTANTSPKSLQPKAGTSKAAKRKLKTYKRKAKKAKVDSDTSSDSDVDLDDVTQDDDDDEIDELNLEAFNKPYVENTDTLVEIEIDKLPTTITTVDDGKVFEIEIIDKLDKSNGDSEELNVEMQEIEPSCSKTNKAVFKKPKGRCRPRKPTISLNRLGIMPGHEDTKGVERRQTRSRSSK